MDIQVQELIERIKKDGIETATEEAAGIRRAAEAEAAALVEAARREAAAIGEKAKQDAERERAAGLAALSQASRNLLLVFKDEVQALLDRTVAAALSGSYDEGVLKQALPAVLSAWKPEAQASLQVLLDEATLAKLKGFFAEKLASELKGGLELRSDASLSGGFRIAGKDGSAYYDFSAESVAEMLCAYLNPWLSGIMRSAAKGE